MERSLGSEKEQLVDLATRASKGFGAFILSSWWKCRDCKTEWRGVPDSNCPKCGMIWRKELQQGKRKLFDMTMQELEELLVLAGVNLSLIETVEEHEDDEGNPSVHPKYRVTKQKMDTGDGVDEAFLVYVWEEGSDADCYPWYVQMGEVVMPYGINANTLAVV